MKTHKLKIQERFYWAVDQGIKKVEIRFDDRDFQKGDYLEFDVLWEKSDDDCVHIDASWRSSLFRITHVLHFPDGLKDGYVALSIQKVRSR